MVVTASADLADQRLAGAHGLAADVDGAGSAESGAAAELGAFVVQDIAEHPQEGHIRGYVGCDLLAVYGQFIGHGGIPLSKVYVCYNRGMRTRLTVLVLLLGAAAGADDYSRTLREWRAQREAKLKADDGWLTVVGLTWLKEGENRVGSNPGFEVQLPKSAPDKVGTLT